MQAHLWTLSLPRPSFLEERMEALVEDFGQLIPYLPPLAAPDGRLLPVGDRRILAFNGRYPAEGEPFTFPGEEVGGEGLEYVGSCATRRRPYDLAVQVALLLAHLHFGNRLAITAAGSLGEWAKAALLIEGKLAYPIDLYRILRRNLYPVTDGRGVRFLYEGPMEGGVLTVSVVEDALKRAGRLLGERWPFTPPYEVGQEPVRLDPVELATQRLLAAAYRPSVRWAP